MRPCSESSDGPPGTAHGCSVFLLLNLANLIKVEYLVLFQWERLEQGDVQMLRRESRMGIRWGHPDGWTRCGWSTGNEGGGIQWGQANADAGRFLGSMKGEGVACHQVLWDPLPALGWWGMYGRLEDGR